MHLLFIIVSGIGKTVGKRYSLARATAGTHDEPNAEHDAGV